MKGIPMSRVKCRCGNYVLFEPAPGAESVKVLCHRCGSRIRVKVRQPESRHDETEKRQDGFIRFFCPCGRRLKVISQIPLPSHGRCPDCGRTVPVPPQRSLKVSNPLEVPTTEMSEEEARSFAAWISKFNE